MIFTVKYFHGAGCQHEKMVGLESDKEITYDEVQKWIPFILGMDLNVMLLQVNPGDFIFYIDDQRFQQR